MTMGEPDRPAHLLDEAAGGQAADARPGRTDGLRPRLPLRRLATAQPTPAALALAAILAIVAIVTPAARTYGGTTLLLASFIPLTLASIAQMFIIAIGDIDLGIGQFLGLINGIAVVLLPAHPALGILALIGGVAGYLLMGLVVHLRKAPAIVVTLGASFVWLGCALLLLPAPGGTAPGYLVRAMNLTPPIVPYPIIFFVVLGIVAVLLLRRWRGGKIIRGIGGSPSGVRRAGISVGWGVLAAYLLAGCFAVLAGLAISGVATSGDANIGTDYTLNTIAAVVLGGGQLAGGKVSGAGTVLGALVVGLIGAVLAFLHIDAAYDFAAEGLVLLIVVSLRLLGSRRAVLG
jgi:ribose/xylose/arabinose/galactoside ABC-type transport system permease subunit